VEFEVKKSWNSKSCLTGYKLIAFLPWNRSEGKAAQIAQADQEGKEREEEDKRIAALPDGERDPGGRGGGGREIRKARDIQDRRALA
jgi:hypothetical protein